MIARILCRLGLHSWKPVLKPPVWRAAYGLCFIIIADKCRRCGKRVQL